MTHATAAERPDHGDQAETADPHVPTKLFAKIKRTSKYSGQHPRNADPFPVHFKDYRDAYPVYGNSNEYRLGDLRFFIKLGDTFVELGL